MFTLLEQSPPTVLKNTNVHAHADTDADTESDINIFSQYFVHSSDDYRRHEIKGALRFNLMNKHVNKIYLLNERIYTREELGLEGDKNDALFDKIIQVNIGRRLRFSDFFNYVNDNDIIKGYNVLINIDIFLDDTIAKLRRTDISYERKMFSLLRFEYRGESDIKTCALFGEKRFFVEEFYRNNQQLDPKSEEGKNAIPNDISNVNSEARPDSWDTWIIHSNQCNKLTKKQIKLFNFELGQPGCDNKIIYLFKILGYEIYNDPYLIRTYHYHRTIRREYSQENRVERPYGLLVPSQINSYHCRGSLGVDVPKVMKHTNKLETYHFTNDNHKFRKYIEDKLKSGKKFVVPRIAGEENNYVFFTILMNEKKIDMMQGVKMLRNSVMKNNAGIKITTFTSSIKYANLYLKAFHDCDMYSVWEEWGPVYKAIIQSHDFITGNFSKPKGKDQVWAFVFDIYHYIHNNPWTHALRGKRILIISPFVDSIKRKVETGQHKLIYGEGCENNEFDLFPGCTFIYLRPPQTQADQPSREFDIEFTDFADELDKIKNKFDVALVSCGGYGNLACGYIYDRLGKSAIYVGGVLQMYFGIYGQRWMRERKDILRMYMNEHWSRPTEEERPLSHTKVENNAYW